MTERLPTPPDETIRLWLNPQTPAEDAVLTYMFTTMRRQTPTLAVMLSREFKAAMREAGLTARRECLLAVVEIFAEVHGIDAVHEAISGVQGGGQR